MLSGPEVNAADVPGGTTALAGIRQEIEYLQRWYTRATDLFCQDSPTAKADALEVYRRIFTVDANIRTEGFDAPPIEGIGPEGWAAAVDQAISHYAYTQHLIGAQLVHIDQLNFADDEIIAGHATMNSYLQAWHSDHERSLLLVMASYESQVRYVPDTGWQIYDMRVCLKERDLRQLS